MGIKLSSAIVGSHVDLGLVNKANDLEIVRSLHELKTGDGTSGDDTSTAALLSAPGDLLALGVADGGIGDGRRPNTPIVGMVDEGSLAEGIGALSGRIAEVVTLLSPTDAIVGICLVRLEKAERGSAIRTIMRRQCWASGNMQWGFGMMARVKPKRQTAVAVQKVTYDARGVREVLGGQRSEGRGGPTLGNNTRCGGGKSKKGGKNDGRHLGLRCGRRS